MGNIMGNIPSQHRPLLRTFSNSPDNDRRHSSRSDVSTSAFRSTAFDRDKEEESLMIHNCFLSAGDIRRFRLQRRKAVEKLQRFGLLFCYIVAPNLNGRQQQQNRDSRDAAILSEILELLKESSQLNSATFRGPFPRHQEDVHSLLTAMDGYANLQEIAMGAWYLAQSHVTFDQAWIPFIQSNHGLERLNLDSFDLSDEEASINNMIHALSGSGNLKFLGLRSCRVTDLGLSRLVQSLILPFLKNLETLQMACNETLTPESLHSFASLLESHERLRSLDLVGNKPCFSQDQGQVERQQRGGGSEDRFLQALERNRTLSNLSLIYCDIGDSFVQRLFESIQGEKKHTLRVLDLDYNQITRKVGMGRYCLQALPKLSVSHLGLFGLKRHRHHSHTQEGADIRQQRQQQPLADWRCSGGKSCHAIQEALFTNKSLISLNLDSVCCHQLCEPILLRNQILLDAAKLHRLPIHLFPLWMEHSRKKESRNWRKNDDDDVVKAPFLLSSIYCVLQNNPLIGSR